MPPATRSTPAAAAASTLDDHTSGVAVYGNILSQADTGINLGGGKDNVVTNNISINCTTSVSLGSRGIDSFAKPSAALGKDSPCYKTLMRPLYHTELWTSRYPNLLAPLDMDPIEAQNAHGNTIRDNVAVGSGEVKIRNAVPRDEDLQGRRKSRAQRGSGFHRLQ